MYIEVSPAYGRDYKNKKEVQDAWDSGVDFLDNRTRQYMSKRDIDPEYVSVIVRYGNGRKVMNV